MPRAAVVLLSILISVCAFAQIPHARGDGVVVAIIHTGVDYNHPALGGGFGPGFKVVGGWDFVDDDADPWGSGWGGAWMAGIIAAESDELTGVAPGVTLLSYRVEHLIYVHLPNTDPDLPAAFDRAVKDGADVILTGIDIHGSDTDPLSQAVERAVRAGVVVVAPAADGGEVASPAASEYAIAVGARFGDNPYDLGSAYGPPRGMLRFKPDVLAPGSLETTGDDGTIHPFQGSHAAAAYVTGVVALLREKHPHWTPHEIKSALVTTASEVDAPSLLRGAGLIDPKRAESRPLFVSETGLLFGINAETKGSWSRSRTITVDNPSTRTETLHLSATRLPDGASMTFWPAELKVPAGGTAELRVELTMRNDAIPFNEVRRGGDIVMRGTEAWRIPWAFVRATRLRFPGVFDEIEVMGADGTRVWAGMDNRGDAEVYVRPGTYDMVREDCLWYTCRLHILEQQTVGGETTELQATTTTYPIELAARDETGKRLADLPRSAKKTYSSQFRMECPGCRPGETAGNRFSTLEVSKVSDRFTFHAVETFFDLEQDRAFRVAHEPLRGVQGATTLRLGPSDYRQARLTWPVRPSGNTIELCDGYWHRDYPLGYVVTADCARAAATADREIAYFATPEEAKANPLDMVGLLIRDEDVLAPLIQSREDGFLLSSQPVPSVVDPRFRDGDEIAFKQRPLHPFGFASQIHYKHLGGLTAFRGPLGEVYRGDFTWTLTATDGAKTHGTAQTLSDYNYVEAGVLEVRAGDALAEVVRPLRGSAPSFTSARVIYNDGGREGQKNGRRPVYLQFSASGQGSGLYGPLRREATRAFWRPSGTAEWIALPVQLSGTEEPVLWNIPAGDIYRADLRSLPPGTADLRLEVTDLHGSKVAVTQLRALTIANATHRDRP